MWIWASTGFKHYFSVCTTRQGNIFVFLEPFIFASSQMSSSRSNWTFSKDGSFTISHICIGTTFPSVWKSPRRHLSRNYISKYRNTLRFSAIQDQGSSSKFLMSMCKERKLVQILLFRLQTLAVDFCQVWHVLAKSVWEMNLLAGSGWHPYPKNVPLYTASLC